MAAKSLSGMSLLIADDHVDSAELLQMLLVASGASDVRVTHTGGSTLELLESWRPSALLLDISLPDMDGYELLQRIRRIEEFEKVPAIAVTGHTSERDRASAVRAGFAVHVVKPIDTEALIHVLGELGAAHPSTPALSATLAELDGVLASKGIVEALRLLNTRSDYRYTALYQYEGATLKSVALVDRLDPTTTVGGDVPVETSFCWMVQRDRASFSTADGSVDPRVTGLPLRRDIKAYCGALVRRADGTPFGSLCHFDHVPRSISEAELALLEQFAPALARVVSPDVF